MLTYNQQQLVYWIHEREKIRLAKEFGEPKPWSSDPIMQETYFCNVDREDDKVTRWIRENITYEKFGNYTDLVVLISRIFNLPSTLEVFLECWEEEDCMSDTMSQFRFSLDIMYDQDIKLWNGAYIVSTNGKKISKLDYCFDLFERFHILVDNNDTKNWNECWVYHNAITLLDGIGSFMSGQIIADLKNTEGHHLYNATDKERFCVPGPGSLRGLGWFFQDKVTEKNFQPYINMAFDMLFFELDDAILKKLDMQNLQNCFCEYDKFMRVKNGTGRSKRKYNGEK